MANFVSVAPAADAELGSVPATVAEFEYSVPLHFAKTLSECSHYCSGYSVTNSGTVANSVLAYYKLEWA